MRRGSHRRDFLKATALTGVGFWVTGKCVATESKSPNEKLQIASIGVGGKGSSDCDQANNHGKIIAICDIDDNTLAQKAEKFPDAVKYNDFRDMLTKMERDIDAVTVSTPDHTHAPASIMAMRLGKHVYCQKPLTHTVWEARMMRETAKKYRVATQMGNQGTAENGLREAVEIIRAGTIGPVREVHVWTNRPIWPQAPDVTARPTDVGEPPSNVHWDLFLGPAPVRPYAFVTINGERKPAYHPFAWRGWWDYGTGALGDMACHTANMAFMACNLGYPKSVHAECGDYNPETYPSWAHVTLEFAGSQSMPPITWHWYEGKRDGNKLLPPSELFHGEKPPGSGSLLVGEKGILYSPNDYGASYMLLPKSNFEDFKKPEPYLPRNGRGDDGMKAEWIAAAKGGPPAMSNFDYAGMLTETVLLGNIGIRFAGTKLEWDGPNLTFTNKPDANKFVSKEYRKGWEIVL
jgi:predicted dehydrogenase